MTKNSIVKPKGAGGAGPPGHNAARSPLLTVCSTLQACARRLGVVVFNLHTSAALSLRS